MYLLVTDETAMERGKEDVRFFMYGGVILPIQNVLGLHNEIESIRNRHGFRPVDSLKFASRNLPDHLTREAHTAAKTEVLEACGRHHVQFISMVVLHELARNRSHDELVQWGANTILGAFHKFLDEADDHGMALMDRLPVEHPFRYLKEKFETGLMFPGGASRPMPRIIGYSLTCDNASHLSSAMDILLGSFRYCVNEPERDIAGRAMFPSVVELMWSKTENGHRQVLNRGLITRPNRIDHQDHNAEYQALIARLFGLLNPS